MKKEIFILLLTFLSKFSIAQSNLNVAGHTAQINGATFEYSIGEMTLVSTERNASLIVTQGILQPTSSGGGATDASGHGLLSDMADHIKVYPNPTQHLLFVESTEDAISDFAYNLLNASGKIVLSQSGQTQVGLNKLSLDLRSFASGSYYLMLNKNGKNYSYKIQKMN
jgi:hypothetical protein